MSKTATPIGERVTAVEVEVRGLREGIKELAGTVTLGMGRLRAELAEQSLNGRTAIAKELVDDIGDAESRAALKEMILNHDRREWLSRPIARWVGAVFLVVLGAVAGHFLP